MVALWFVALSAFHQCIIKLAFATLSRYNITHHSHLETAAYEIECQNDRSYRPEIWSAPRQRYWQDACCSVRTILHLEIFTLHLLCNRSWWRHQMETLTALLALCAWSPFTGEFPSQRPVTRSFGAFFDLYKRLSKQSWGWWFETPSRPLWRHCNVHALTEDRS